MVTNLVDAGAVVPPRSAGRHRRAVPATPAPAAEPAPVTGPPVPVVPLAEAGPSVPSPTPAPEATTRPEPTPAAAPPVDATVVVAADRAPAAGQEADPSVEATVRVRVPAARAAAVRAVLATSVTGRHRRHEATPPAAATAVIPRLPAPAGEAPTSALPSTTDSSTDSATVAVPAAAARTRRSAVADLLAAPTMLQRRVTGRAPAPAPPVAAPAATAFAEVLADVLGVPEVAPDAHFFDDLGADSMLMARFCARARKRSDLPSVSMKDVYRHSTVAALATALAPAPAAAPSAAPDPAATGFAEVLAEVLGVPEVAPDAHFFDDLGADSMLMARFCARARKRSDLPTVSIKDVYRHTTVTALAAAHAPAPSPAPTATPAGPEPTGAWAPADLPAAVAVTPVPEAGEPVGTPRYVLCGALQLLIFLTYSAAASLVSVQGFVWVAEGVTMTQVYLRSVAFTSGMFAALCVLPIVAKWVLVGRWKPRQIRVWSLAYLRFWTVKVLIRSNPLALFVGSPLYAFYLRALGAKVGRGVAIFTRAVPVCTDLFTVGDGTVVRKESFLSCYRAHDGVIQTGPVTLGRDVFVGEKTVLDIGTAMGDGAQLGHTSSLHSGQAVPAGEHWHGSPAERTDVDYRTVDAAPRSRVRQVGYTLVQLVSALVLLPPLALAAVRVLFVELPLLARLVDSGAMAFRTAEFWVEALVVSSVLFWTGTLLGLLGVVTVPRLLNRMLRPGRVYRLYGFHYWLHRLIGGLSNRKFFTELFGDSSFVVGYLRAIGYRLRPVVQTGSNFGMAVQHENPFLSRVGSGTVVADGLSLLNADYSSTSFRVSEVSIGRDNFLGNHIAYPAQGRTGDNCLLGTKVLVPIEGELREGVGLLGSPSFEIPRTVARDSNLDVGDPAEQRRLLRAKNRHNAVTIGLRLLSRWVHLFGMLVLTLGAVDLFQVWGAIAFVPFTLAGLLFTVFFFVAVERAVDPLRIRAPDGCSIYAHPFWRHERAWKVPNEAYYAMFDGTPFKSVLWRMLGVRIGRRVFDDGCILTERSFTAIGDGCTLNAGSVIQCHSQEDGAFKSDHTVLGAGCTLGVGAFVHYGVTMGDGAVLAPDSFLMKGEEIAPRGHWGGNPAIEVYDSLDDLPGVLAGGDVRVAVRPARPVTGLGRVAAIAGPAALATLVVTTLTGGVALAFGAPVPFLSVASSTVEPAADAADDATDTAEPDATDGADATDAADDSDEPVTAAATRAPARSRPAVVKVTPRPTAARTTPAPTSAPAPSPTTTTKKKKKKDEDDESRSTKTKSTKTKTESTQAG